MIVTRFKAWRLKRKARKHYEAYQSAVGGMSCGRQLAEQISSSAYKHKRAFNEAMDKLAAVDKSCPEFRL